MTALKRREKPLKEKRYLYYIYTCTYVTALTTLTTMTTMTTLEIKLSIKIRKKHPNIPPQFNTFSNIDKFDKFDKFDKTINRVEAQFVIIQKNMFIDD